MTRIYLLLALAALLAWASAYGWYFHRDIRHWWHQRAARKQEARAQRAARLAELARQREELAAKYLPPGSGAGPRA